MSYGERGWYARQEISFYGAQSTYERWERIMMCVFTFQATCTPAAVADLDGVRIHSIPKGLGRAAED